MLVHTVLRTLVIFGPGITGPAETDALNFHQPTVEQFVQQWPSPDVSDYAAASTPGHHLALAAIDDRFDPSLETLRLISGTPVTLMIGLFVFYCSARAGPTVAILSGLPLMCSPHTVGFSTHVLPESSAWAFVLLLMILAMRDRFTNSTTVVAGLVVLFCVLTRQVNLWTASLVWLAAWLGPKGNDPPSDVFAPPIQDRASRAKRTAIAFVATLPAFAVIAWFYSIWGSLTPGRFIAANVGPNPVTPAFMLSLCGLAGLAFFPVFLPALRQAISGGAPVVPIVGSAAALGLLIGILPESTYSFEEGRVSGIWEAVRVTPTVFDRSPLIVIGSAVGAGFAAACLLVAPGSSSRWLLTLALVASTAAQSANAQAYQRYMEPMVLLLFPIAAACAIRARGASPHPLALLGPVTLAALLAIVTLGRIV